MQTFTFQPIKMRRFPAAIDRTKDKKRQRMRGIVHVERSVHVLNLNLFITDQQKHNPPPPSVLCWAIIMAEISGW